MDCTRNNLSSDDSTTMAQKQAQTTQLLANYTIPRCPMKQQTMNLTSKSVFDVVRAPRQMSREKVEGKTYEKIRTLQIRVPSIRRRPV